MEELCTAVSLICCGEYKNDSIVKAFCGIYSNDREEALNCYSRVCEILLSKGVTLSEYMFHLALDADNQIFSRYIRKGNDFLRVTIENDLSVLSKIASLNSQRVISYLKEKFSIPDSVSFPVYEAGKTAVNIDSVLFRAKRYGTSVFEKNKAFSFDGESLMPAANFDRIRLSNLKNYRSQRQKILNNTLCFLSGQKAQNVLLYGDRGTGKSSTVKAIVNEYPLIRAVQIPKSEIPHIYKVYELVRNNPLKFILFIDDISFGDGDEGYSALKQVLEGSVVSMPENCLIYATTNRRHIIKETNSERTGDELHAADARDENMSLADRFGLYITFSLPNKDEYLDIVRQIAADRGLKIDAEELEQLAERYALKKCGRSPRTAKQFVDIMEARSKLDLDYDF